MGHGDGSGEGRHHGQERASYDARYWESLQQGYPPQQGYPQQGYRSQQQQTYPNQEYEGGQYPQNVRIIVAWTKC